MASVLTFVSEERTKRGNGENKNLVQLVFLFHSDKSYKTLTMFKRTNRTIIQKHYDTLNLLPPEADDHRRTEYWHQNVPRRAPSPPHPSRKGKQTPAALVPKPNPWRRTFQAWSLSSPDITHNPMPLLRVYITAPLLAAQPSHFCRSLRRPHPRKGCSPWSGTSSLGMLGRSLISPPEAGSSTSTSAVYVVVESFGSVVCKNWAFWQTAHHWTLLYVNLEGWK